jgi:hypothetical protein
MKRFFLLIIFIFAGCGYYYSSLPVKKEQTVQNSYIFGTFSYSNKFSFLGGRIGLDIKDENRINPDTYFAFEKEKGFFLFPLKAGKYCITSIKYYDDSTYTVFDSQVVNYSFEVLSNQVVYLGNFTPNLSFDVEYIYWGIAKVENNAIDDRKFLIENIEDLKNFDFVSHIPEKLGKIKKLKYSPASPGSNAIIY